MSGEGSNEAPVSEGIRALAVDGDADGQRGEGAAAVEPSTQGREVGPDWWAVTTLPRPELLLLLNERDELRARIADLERALLDADGCRQLALGRAEQAESRVAELEAAQRWVPLAEQLPPQDGNTDVEVATFRLPECPRGAIALLDESGQWIPEDGPLDFTPTHWRALGPSYEAIRAQVDEYGVWRHAGPDVPR